MVHGDLRGVRVHFESHFNAVLTPCQSNVIVDVTGRAKVTDFGLAVVTQSLDSTRSTLDELGHNARWVAPEILDGRGLYSKEGDIFSFAMVTIEVRWNNSPRLTPGGLSLTLT